MATDTPERVPVAIKPVSGWSNHAFLGHDRAPIVFLTKERNAVRNKHNSSV